MKNYILLIITLVFSNVNLLNAQLQEDLLLIRCFENPTYKYLELNSPADTVGLYEDDILWFEEDFSEHYSFRKAFYYDGDISMSGNEKGLV